MVAGDRITAPLPGGQRPGWVGPAAAAGRNINLMSPANGVIDFMFLIDRYK